MIKNSLADSSDRFPFQKNLQTIMPRLNEAKQLATLRNLWRLQSTWFQESGRNTRLQTSQRRLWSTKQAPKTPEIFKTPRWISSLMLTEILSQIRSNRPCRRLPLSMVLWNSLWWIIWQLSIWWAKSLANLLWSSRVPKTPPNKTPTLTVRFPNTKNRTRCQSQMARYLK